MDNANMRLNEIIRHLGLTQKQLADELGTSQSAISAIAKGTRPLTEGFACRVESMYGVSATWLLTGEGDREKSQTKPVKTTLSKTEGDRIPLIPASAFAGGVSGFAPETLDPRNCEMVVSPVAGAEFAIPITGDSMEPEYPDGSLAYIKKINDTAFIPWGHTVILDTENGAFIKRIYPDPENEKYVWAKSINPAYPPMHVPKSSIFRIFRVLGTSRIFTTM